MDFSWKLLEAPASEPLSLNQAKAHLRIELDVTDFDDLISGYIASARDLIESRYNLRIRRQKWELLLPEFPREDRFKIPAWPVQSIDYLKYRNIDDQVTTMTATTEYRGRLHRKPAEVILPTYGIWPAATLQSDDPVMVGLTLGWITGASPEPLLLPAQVLEAMRLLLSHQFENGAAVTVGDQSHTLELGLDGFMENVRLYW